MFPGGGEANGPKKKFKSYAHLPKGHVETYYARYGPMVLRRCRKLLQDNEKSFDALQDVFEKLLLYRESLKGTYPSALLYRIATNVCLKYIIKGEKESTQKIAVMYFVDGMTLN
jgi:DNA-directed RNA polymerase specialized sigma24 family protein